jgi:hypothetical protein
MKGPIALGTRVKINSATVAYNGLIGIVERKTPGISTGKVIYHCSFENAVSSTLYPFYASELERVQ